MKKIFAIICAVIILCSLAGCEDYENTTVRYEKETIEEMGFVIIEQIYVAGDNSAYIVYDSDTNVEYLIYDGYRSFSISPYYDENGNVAIYGG